MFTIELNELKAFPTAEGHGALATNDIDNEWTIIYVTTLSDTGIEGSLRWALTREYPRIILFAVGGEFENSSLIFLDYANSDLIIAGQTANDLGGVHLVPTSETGDKRFYIQDVENLQIRFMDIKSGWWSYQADGTRHAPYELVGCYNAIIDHVSSGWGSYTNNISKINTVTQNAGKVTYQRSLGVEGILGHNTGHVTGLQMDYIRDTYTEGEQAEKWDSWEGLSYHHNASIGLTHRFPNTSGNAGQNIIVNNFVYGWVTRLNRHTNGNAPLDIYRNYYEAANYNLPISYNLMHKFDYNPTYNLDTPIEINPNIFIAENLILQNDGTVFQDVDDDNWAMFTQFATTSYGNANDPILETARRYNKEIELIAPITLQSTLYVKDNVLENVGSGVRFDTSGNTINENAIDSYYIGWALNDTAPSTTSSTIGDGGLGDSNRFVHPTYTGSSLTLASFDANLNGLPDSFEAEHEVSDPFGTKSEWTFGDVTVKNNAGYSNISIYLAWKAGDFDPWYINNGYYRKRGLIKLKKRTLFVIN